MKKKIKIEVNITERKIANLFHRIVDTILRSNDKRLTRAEIEQLHNEIYFLFEKDNYLN